jgi:hypothetical protein
VSIKTKAGRAYVPIGSVGNFTDEMGRDLFKTLLGERTRETFGHYENVLEHHLFTEKFPTMKMLKPESWIVIEVEFEKMSTDHAIRGPTILLTQDRTIGKPWITEVHLKGYHTYGLRANKFIKLRPDKDPLNPQDVRHTQANSAGGFDIRVRQNPPEINFPLYARNPKIISKSSRTHVLSNPFYGWGSGPRLVASGDGPTINLEEEGFEDGIIIEPYPGTPIGHKPRMATTIYDKYLPLRREFENQLENTKLLGTGDKWGLHYDPEQMAFPKNKQGVDYYLDVPGFPVGSEDAIFDIEGPNLGGTVHDRKKEEPFYYDQLTLDYQLDKDQLKRDNQIAANINMVNFQEMDKPLSERDYDDYDDEFYVSQNEIIGSRMGKKSTGSQEHLKMRQRSLDAKGIEPIKNPAEESISEEEVPETKSGFAAPFEVFMVFDDEGDVE